MAEKDQAGWVKLHRSMLEWGWYDDHAVFRLFVHILLRCRWEPKEYRGEMLPPGSFVTGRRRLADETGLSEQQVRTALDKLVSTSEITIAAYNKYSVISVVNWDEYQRDNQQSTSDQPADNQQATNKQPTINHNIKKERKKEDISTAGDGFDVNQAFKDCETILDDCGYDRGRFEVSAGSYEPMLNILRQGVTVHALRAAAGSIPPERATTIGSPPSYIAKLFASNRDRFMATQPPDPGMAAYGAAVSKWQDDGRQGPMPRIEDYVFTKRAANDG